MCVVPGAVARKPAAAAPLRADRELGEIRDSFAGSMRLGLLGPAGGDVNALEQGARFLLEREQADRIIYLGIDGALDRLVLDWARRLVGDEDPSDDALFRRAVDRCLHASSEAIDSFIEAERERERLKTLECLPRASARVIEMLHGRVAILLYDKSKLDAEDLRAATLLVYGRSAEPVIHRDESSKIYVSPGPLSSRSGIALLDSHRESGELRIRIFDLLGEIVRAETLGQNGHPGRRG